jgi:hypothetical protein
VKSLVGFNRQLVARWRATLLSSSGDATSDYYPPTYQGVGGNSSAANTILYSAQNNAIGASYFAIVSNDRSQLTKTTVTIRAPLVGTERPGLDWIVDGEKFEVRFAAEPDMSARDIALGIGNAVVSNAALINALRAYRPDAPYTRDIGYTPFEGTVESQTFDATLYYDQPWGEGNSVTPVSTTSIDVTTEPLVLDVGPTMRLAKFIPGYQPDHGDQGPAIFFIGQANAESVGLDTFIGAIFSVWKTKHEVALGLMGSGPCAVEIGAESVVANGTFSTNGRNAGVEIVDRVTERRWQWYAHGDKMCLWNGSRDVLTIDMNGSIWSAAEINQMMATVRKRK